MGKEFKATTWLYNTVDIQKIKKLKLVCKLFSVLFLLAISQSILLAQNIRVYTPIGAIRIVTNDYKPHIDPTCYFSGCFSLKFFSDTSDQSYDRIKEVRFTIGDDISIENQEQDFPWFNNMFVHAYGSELICVGEAKNYYKIIVNKSGLCYWVKKNRFLELMPIKEYLKSFIGVKMVLKQNVYSKPDKNSSIIPHATKNEQETFTVLQVKGDWIEIKTSEYGEDEGSHKSNFLKSGWIKWHSNNMLLIGIIDSM